MLVVLIYHNLELENKKQKKKQEPTLKQVSGGTAFIKTPEFEDLATIVY